MTKLILHLDMDGVLVDLADEINRLPSMLREKYGQDIDEVPGLFDRPAPLAGAVEAVRQLADSGRYEMHVLSTSPWGNPGAFTAKRLWLEHHFGDLFKKRMTLTHRKDLVKGDILVDDRPNNGADAYMGKWIKFGSTRYPDWDAVLIELLADGYFWFGPFIGAVDSQLEAMHKLMVHWLDEGHKSNPELPANVASNMLELSASGLESGTVTLPEGVEGPFNHPLRPQRMLAWLPRAILLEPADMLTFAHGMGLRASQFIRSETPHRDAVFLKKALEVVLDIGGEVGGCNIGEFKIRCVKSTRTGNIQYRPGSFAPLVHSVSDVLRTYGIEFIQDNMSYVFQSSGPLKGGVKTVHLAHRINGHWSLGKKMLEYIS